MERGLNDTYQLRCGQTVARVAVESHDIGFCHGDCLGHNVHKNNGIFTYYDFDCCGVGLRVFDLATFKWGVVSNKNAEKLWDTFLNACRADRQITEADLNLIDTFVAIRHIW